MRVGGRLTLKVLQGVHDPQPTEHRHDRRQLRRLRLASELEAIRVAGHHDRDCVDVVAACIYLTTDIKSR